MRYEVQLIACSRVIPPTMCLVGVNADRRGVVAANLLHLGAVFVGSARGLMPNRCEECEDGFGAEWFQQKRRATILLRAFADRVRSVACCDNNRHLRVFGSDS